MKIIADENIILLDLYFAKNYTLIKKPGRAITSTDVKDADILLVRSVTEVNANLLKNSTVKFVGSLATGTDHLDIAWLNKNNILWATANGANKTAVVEYVISIITALKQEKYLLMKKPRAAVIGVGNIGSAVSQKLTELNFAVVECDPLREILDPNFKSTPIQELSDFDLITIHTPLTFTGNHPTYHLIAADFLKRQKPNCILLNTSRGSVIDFAALKNHGTHLVWCLDVWENEPVIDMEVLPKTFIATPHIAGYSIQSKYRALEMILKSLVQYKLVSDEMPQIPYPTITIPYALSQEELILEIYDPRKTSRYMKAELKKNPAVFDELRKNFIDRYEFAYVKIK